MLYSDELYHHGIKGQKWGVRRYQNSDGSLTAAGKQKLEKYKSRALSEESDRRSKKAALFDKSIRKEESRMAKLEKKGKSTEGSKAFVDRVKMNSKYYETIHKQIVNDINAMTYNDMTNENREVRKRTKEGIAFCALTAVPSLGLSMLGVPGTLTRSKHTNSMRTAKGAKEVRDILESKNETRLKSIGLSKKDAKELREFLEKEDEIRKRQDEDALLDMFLRESTSIIYN